MIEETEGVVVEQLKNNRAKVKIRKRSSCNACSHKGFCNPFGKDSMIIMAANPLNAERGQTVRINFKSEKEGRAVIILYIIPLIGLIAGAFIGNTLNLFGNQDVSAIFFSILFLAGILLVIRYYSQRKYEKDTTYKPTIIEIVKDLREKG